MTTSKILWGLSGGSTRAISLFEAANVSMKKGNKPDVIIGTSSGALVAPIIAVAYDDKTLMNEAIEFARTLTLHDMFPYKGNKPVNKKGNIPFNSIMRVLIGGYNHLGWQDINSLYKKVFKQRHFEIFKKSNIECLSFCVNARTKSVKINKLNEATSLDDMIRMIEESSRITPLVQNINGFIDGGFISFNPAMWVLKDNNYKIKECITIYSNEMNHCSSANELWDKNILSVTQQVLSITSHWLGVKDLMIETLECKLQNIKHLAIECPNGNLSNMYDVDTNKLSNLGNESAINAELMWEKYNSNKHYNNGSSNSIQRTITGI